MKTVAPAVAVVLGVAAVASAEPLSLLEGRVNKLVNSDGLDPRLESVLRTMYDAGCAMCSSRV